MSPAELAQLRAELKIPAPRAAKTSWSESQHQIALFQWAKLATTTEAAVYASSKTAVLSITRSFAYAFAPSNVRVNAICPGIIDTPMQDRVLADVAAKRVITVEELSATRNRTVPLGRSASADECAGAIWFLLGDASSYMTGQAINYTGGLVMW